MTDGLHFPIAFLHEPFVSSNRHIVKSNSLPYKAVSLFTACFEIFSESF